MYLVVALAIILLGGVFIWQKSEKPNVESSIPMRKELPILEAPKEWKAYENKTFGFSLEYPGEWGSVKFLSGNADDTYYLQSTDSTIKSILYHNPSKRIAFLSEKNGELLAIIYRDKAIKGLYKLLPKERISDFSFSPSGRYISFLLLRNGKPLTLLLDADNGVDILEGHDISYSDPTQALLWGPGEKTLAIQETRGLFVSDYENPSLLNTAISFTQEESLGNSFISNLRFIEENKLAFEVFKRKYSAKEARYYEEEYAKYEYNTETKKSSYTITAIGSAQGNMLNGRPCLKGEDCRSHFCSPGPLNWNLCLHDRFTCVKPGNDGIKQGETYFFQEKTYQCKGPDQLYEVIK